MPNHPDQSQILPRVISQSLPHLAQRAQHIDFCTYAIDHGALLHCITETLDLSVQASNSRRYVALPCSGHRDVDELRSIRSSWNSSWWYPQLRQPGCVLIRGRRCKCNVGPLRVHSTILRHHLARWQEQTDIPRNSKKTRWKGTRDTVCNIRWIPLHIPQQCGSRTVFWQQKKLDRRSRRRGWD